MRHEPTRDPVARRARRAAAALTVLVALGAACHGGSACAGRTAYWRTDSYAGFLRGTPSGVSLLESGHVIPGASLEALDVPECDYVWTAAIGPRGEIYVTTGTPGKLCRADAGGGRVIIEMDDVDLPALAVGWDGDLFVGTSPGGNVLRVDADGVSELFHETGENYIWAMAFSPKHGLLVGTGEEAKIIALDSRGRAHTLATPADLNVVTLAVVGDRVLAGTGGDGLLLDVTPGSDPRVLYDTHHDEVSGVVGEADGSLLLSGSSISVDQALDDMADPSLPIGDGAVYRTTDGGAYEIWRSTEAPVVSLGRAPDGSVVAGMGDEGRIFAVDPGSHGLVSDLDEGEVLSIMDSGDGVILTTGTPGGVYRMGARAGDGVYESRVFDAVTSARWGACLVDGDRTGDIEIETRGGSIESPDDTWSDWEALDGGVVATRPSRFLQWRATFSGERASLRAVEIAYLRENVPPEVVAVTVSDAASGFGSNGFGGESATRTLPSGLEVTYSLDKTRRDAAGLPPVARGLRTVEWDAFDPNGDELVFDLYVRSEKEDGWWLMAGDLELPVHTWDSFSMPDGEYRVRVVATDRPDNDAASAFEAERTSSAFVIDNTPPAVDGIRLDAHGSAIVLTVDVEDATSPIAAIEVSIDYDEWRPVLPADGMLDARAEAGRLELGGLEPGPHAVSVRAFDRTGNVGVARVVAKP